MQTSMREGSPERDPVFPGEVGAVAGPVTNRRTLPDRMSKGAHAVARRCAADSGSASSTLNRYGSSAAW